MVIPNQAAALLLMFRPQDAPSPPSAFLVSQQGDQLTDQSGLNDLETNS